MAIGSFVVVRWYMKCPSDGSIPTLASETVCEDMSQKFPAKGRGAQCPNFPRNFGPWAAHGEKDTRQC